MNIMKVVIFEINGCIKSEKIDWKFNTLPKKDDDILYKGQFYKIYSFCYDVDDNVLRLCVEKC